MKLAFLYTETTGLSPEAGDRIVEIAAVKIFDSKSDKIAVFHKYINPERPIPKAVVRIHGIDNQKVSDAPTFSVIGQEFLDFIEGCILVVHKGSFVLGFIAKELPVSELPGFNEMQVIETLEIARHKHPTRRNDLEALSERYDIEKPDGVMHSALFKAYLIAKIYFAMDIDRAKSTTVQNILWTDDEKEQTDDSQLNLSEPTNETMALRIGDYEVELGAEFQQGLADVIPDYPAYKDLFGILAKSNNANIRKSIASRENLSEETVTLLLNDSDFGVVLAVLEHDLGKTMVTDEQMLQVIHHASHEDVIQLAMLIDECVQIHHENITKAVFDLGDPGISISLAHATRWNGDDIVRKSLARFGDKDIRAAAQP